VAPEPPARSEQVEAPASRRRVEPPAASDPAPSFQPLVPLGLPLVEYSAVDRDEPFDEQDPFDEHDRERERFAFGPDEPFAEDHDDDEHEVPSGTRRVARSHRLRAARKASGESGGKRPSRAPRRVRGAHSRARRVISLLALLLAGAVIWFLVQLFQPFHGSGHGSVTVTIPQHSSSSQIGDILARDGVISSSFFFELRATLSGQRSDMRAGTYHLKQDMSYGDVLRTLTTAPPPVKTTELTLIPGRTRRQISALLNSQGIHGSYLAATRHSSALKPTSYGAPRDTPSLEGFLFPDTYRLRDPVGISTLVVDQLKAFRQHFASVDTRYARSKNLTPYDVLIIASMVEAEAATTRDRPLVASVIYNRLHDGMPLQIDATTRYATGNYSSPLTASQLASSSPYNTRINKGLPPTPIDDPGMSAINAAAHPANTNDLYFVVKPCGNGEMTFASDYQQFLTDVARYQAARTRRGGHSPAKC
jgi:uncharacterized YceG family protein